MLHGLLWACIGLGAGILFILLVVSFFRVPPQGGDSC